MNSSWGPLFTPLVAIVGGLIHVRRSTVPGGPGRAAEILLLWFFGAVVGCGGLVVAGSHLFFADFIAGQIGFPADNPFQFEVAVANLSYAVLGLACLRYRGRFWDATAIGFAVFYLGAAVGHLQQYFAHDNTAPYNAGPILITDIGAPVAILALLLWLRLTERRADTATADRRSRTPHSGRAPDERLHGGEGEAAEALIPTTGPGTISGRKDP